MVPDSRVFRVHSVYCYYLFIYVGPLIRLEKVRQYHRTPASSCFPPPPPPSSPVSYYLQRVSKRHTIQVAFKLTSFRGELWAHNYKTVVHTCVVDRHRFDAYFDFSFSWRSRSGSGYCPKFSHVGKSDFYCFFSQQQHLHCFIIGVTIFSILDSKLEFLKKIMVRYSLFLHLVEIDTDPEPDVPIRI
jgi:hypothetical protein